MRSVGIILMVLIIINGASFFQQNYDDMFTTQAIADRSSKPTGAYYTGNYENLFTTLLGKSAPQVKARIDSACQQLFYGDSSTQRIYYRVTPDMAYIEDILHNDVRTEGMSYGMMIAVQSNKKENSTIYGNGRKHTCSTKAEPEKTTLPGIVKLMEQSSTRTLLLMAKNGM